MNIELVIMNFIPEIVGGSIRAYHMCKYLSRFGHSVSVITMNKKGSWLVDDKNFPQPENCKVYRNAGMHIPFLPPASGYVPLLYRSAVKAVRADKIQVIQGASPPIGGAIAAYLAAKKTGKPFIFEAKDPWIRARKADSRSYGGAHMHSGQWLGKLYAKIEEKICYFADKIIVTNPAIKNELMQLHPELEEENFEVIYNAADLDDFDGPAEKFDKYTIFYSGVLYGSRAVGKLIEAARYIDDDMQIVIAGMGPKAEVAAFKKLISQQAGKVKFLGLLPPERIYQLSLGADLLFAGVDTSETRRFNLPLKVFNYMAAGRPILATGSEGGDLDLFLKNNKCGSMLYSTEPKDIADAIIRLRNNKKLTNTLGRNGRKAVEKEFNTETQTRKLEKVYEMVLKK